MKQRKKDFKKMSKSISELWDNLKWSNSGMYNWSPEGREADKIFEEIMSPHFPNLMKTISLQIQED